MSDPTVAISSGVRLSRVNDRLLVENLGMGWVPTTMFVLGLLTVNAVIAGLILFGVVVTDSISRIIVGVVFMALTSGFGFLLFRIAAFARERKKSPIDRERVIAIFDPAAGQLLDGAGQPLAPLDTVRLHRGFQFGSSSPSLQARWSGGRVLLVAGNPFAGSIHAIEQALNAAGY